MQFLKESFRSQMGKQWIAVIARWREITFFPFFFTGGELCSKTPEFKIEVAILYADFMP